MGMHIIKQMKYCEECEGWFEYEGYDSEEPDEKCPEDEGHTTRNHTIIEVIDAGEVFFFPNHDSHYGNFASRSIEANSEDYFTFCVPTDFRELISADMICIPEGSVDDKNIDIDSEYCKAGEAKDNHVESDSDSIYSFVADKLSELNLSGILSEIEAGDSVGIHINHQSIGTTIHYIAIRLKYKINHWK